MGSAVGFLGQVTLFEGRCPTPSISVPYKYLMVNAYYVREVRNTFENSGDDLGFGFLGSSFSENGSTRGVLISDTAAI